MQHKLLNDSGGQRTFAIVLDSGDEVLKSLQSFVNDSIFVPRNSPRSERCSDVVLKYFDWETKDYRKIAVAEQVEVASLIGDVAMAPSGAPALHAHLVVGKRDGTAMAGHLGEAHVRPTLEVVLTESPAHLHKVMDEETGLALIRMED